MDEVDNSSDAKLAATSITKTNSRVAHNCPLLAIVGFAGAPPLSAAVADSVGVKNFRLHYADTQAEFGTARAVVNRVAEPGAGCPRFGLLLA